MRLLLALIVTALIAVESSFISTDNPTSVRHRYKFALKKPYSYYKNHTLPFYEIFGENIQVTHDTVRLTSLGISNQHSGVISRKAFEVGDTSGFDIQLSMSVLGSESQNLGGNGLILSLKTKPDSQQQALKIVFSSGNEKRNMPFIYAIFNGQNGKFLPTEEAAAMGGCYQQYKNTPHPFKVVLKLSPDDVLTLSVGTSSTELTQCITIPRSKDRGVDLLGMARGQGVYIQFEALTGPHSGGDLQDLHSIDVHEIIDHLATPKKLSHKVTEDEQNSYDKVHQRIEELRLKEEEHLESGTGAQSLQDKSQLQRISESQYRILTKLDDLHNKVEFLQTGGSSSGSGSHQLPFDNQQLSEIKQQNGQILELLSDVASYLTHQETKEGAKDLGRIEEMLQSLHSSVRYQTAQAQSDKEHQKLKRSSWDENGFWFGLTVFLSAQVLLGVCYYTIWRRSASVEKQKKFI